MDLADSEIRCNIAGMYDIAVDVGETLTVSGEAEIDLGDPAKSNPSYGTLDCKGKLKVKDKAKIIHANIHVTQASIEDEAGPHPASSSLTKRPRSITTRYTPTATAL
jgi:hypothetical protein